MLDTIGTSVFPSVKLSTLTSGPSRYSSMTTRAPLSPKARSSIALFTASTASSRVMATTTPLPSARPSALTTMGTLALSTYSSAASASSKTSYAAVGMPYFFISPLAKTLLPSIMAARFSGPKQGMPSASIASTMPRHSGSSGVTTA